jgi:hypothetical protein
MENVFNFISRFYNIKYGELSHMCLILTNQEKTCTFMKTKSGAFNFATRQKELTLLHFKFHEKKQQ